VGGRLARAGGFEAEVQQCGFFMLLLLLLLLLLKKQLNINHKHKKSPKQDISISYFW